MNQTLIKTKVLRDSSKPRENEYGETPLPGAPTCESVAGVKVVPQQFLEVNRTLQSVEQILSKINVPSPFVLFAGQENGFVYIVCAVVGHENYPGNSSKTMASKIVYGRRWFLEPSTPTSEVVQTALIAVKKAKEHELRESLRLQVMPNLVGITKPAMTTPFNCHQDLPLMANRRQDFQGDDIDFDLYETLRSITVDGLCLRAVEVKQLSVGGMLYSIELYTKGDKPKVFTEFVKNPVVFACPKNSKATFLHRLFDTLLALSDAEVDEAFSFEGFARFSREICPSRIGKFSFETRNLNLGLDGPEEDFLQSFEDMSYRVDSSKAPTFNAGKLGAMQRSFLRAIEERSGRLEGYLPKEPEIKVI